MSPLPLTTDLSGLAPPSAALKEFNDLLAEAAAKK